MAKMTNTTKAIDMAVDALATMASPSGETKDSSSLSEYAQRFSRGEPVAVGSGGNLGGPRRPYSQSVWPYACITAVASNAARVPLRLSAGAATGTKVAWGSRHLRAGRMAQRRTLCELGRFKGAGESKKWLARYAERAVGAAAVYRAVEGDVVEIGELYALLNQPNESQGFNEFISATVTNLYSGGRVHWLFDEMAGRRVKTMYVVSGKKSTPIIDSSGKVDRLIGWRFRSPQGKQFDVGLDECITFQLYDPDDPHKGLSPMRPASLAIISDYNASLYNAAMFHNSCEPGGVMQTDAPYNEELDEQMRTSWQQRHGGPMNVRKMAILWGGLTYNAQANSLSDMVFPQGKQLDREEICAVFRVPASVAGFFGTTGDAAAYTSNELKRFWQDTEAPLLDKIADAVTLHLCPRFDGSLTAWFDLEEIPIFQELRQAAITSGKELFNMGVPMEDVNEWSALGLPARPWYAVGFLPMGLAPAAEVASGGVVPDYPEGLSDDDDDNSDALGQAEGSEDTPDEDTETTEPTPPQGGEGNDTERGVHAMDTGALTAAGGVGIGSIDEKTAEMVWRRWMASWNPLAKAFRQSLRVRYLSQQRTAVKAVKAAMGEEAKSGARQKDSGIVARVLLEVFNRDDAAKFRLRCRAFMTDAQNLGIRQALTEAGFTGDKLDEAIKRLLENPRITEAIKAEAFKVSGLIDRRTRKILRNSLSAGLSAGEDVRHMADRVQAVMGNRRSAAMVVARNAIAQTLSAARNEGQRSAGMTHKTWMHSRGPGERRPEHITAEREYIKAPIPMADKFFVGGEWLRYPRDFANGSPKNTINCQCVTIATRTAPGGKAASAMARTIRLLRSTGFVSYSDTKQALNEE